MRQYLNDINACLSNARKAGFSLGMGSSHRS